MTEKIIVGFDVEDNGTPKVAKFNDELGNTKQAAENASSGTQKASLSLTDLYSAAQIAEKVLSTLKDAYNATAGETLKYAEQVRQLSTISGESTESTSRFLQVLDDYKLGADDALAATRALTKNGYAPNIETLAQLSDQYLSLTSAQEKNDFILKNLGRSGLGWVEVLQKGSAAIKEQGAAVSQNLILTQKMVDAARENEIAVDNWNDAVQGLKISLGNQLLPVMTSFVNEMNAGQRAAEILAEQNKPLVMGSKDYREALLQAEKEIEATNKAMIEQADASDTAAQAAAEYAAKLEEVSKANQNLINSAIAITDETRKYEDAQADIQAQIADLQAEKDSYYAWDTEKIDAAQEKIDDLSAKYDENAEAFIAAMEKKFVMMAIEKIALEDGVAGYSDAEYQKAQAILQTTDVATAAAFSQAQAQAVLTDAVANGQISVEQFRDILQKAGEDGVISLEEVTAAMNAIPPNKTVTIDVITNGMIPTNLAPTATNAPVGTHRRSNASGGTYMIPMSWGNEKFPIGSSDTASGGELISITPNGGSEAEKEMIQLLRAIAAKPAVTEYTLAQAMRDVVIQVSK